MKKYQWETPQLTRPAWVVRLHPVGETKAKLNYWSLSISADY
jgi:hypothetical protein